MFHWVLSHQINDMVHLMLCTHTHTHTIQFSEIEVEYPGWALFIGAVIILMAVLPIPIVLIGRLVLYQSARDEAIGFFKSIRSDADHLYRVISNGRLVTVPLISHKNLAPPTILYLPCLF